MIYIYTYYIWMYYIDIWYCFSWRIFLVNCHFPPLIFGKIWGASACDKCRARDSHPSGGAICGVVLVVLAGFERSDFIYTPEDKRLEHNSLEVWWKDHFPFFSWVICRFHVNFCKKTLGSIEFRILASNFRIDSIFCPQKIIIKMFARSCLKEWLQY